MFHRKWQALRQFQQTLDGQERPLDRETLLICDAAGPAALAGIMGGQASEELPGHPARVLIESAYFNPAPRPPRQPSAWASAPRPSYRFERGRGPGRESSCALDRAAQLMAERRGRTARWASRARIDVYPAPLQHPAPPGPARSPGPTRMLAAPAYTTATRWRPLLRRPAPARRQCLDRDTLAVQVPSHRATSTREVDLIEEVARLAGFEEIPVTLPRGQVATRRPGPGAPPAPGPATAPGPGLLRGDQLRLPVGAPGGPGRGCPGGAPALANPLSEEQAVMRTSLIPGLLDTLRRNALKQVQDLRLFEAAKVFRPQPGGSLPREEDWLAGLMYGAREEVSWALASREPVDFFDLKGVVEGLLEGLHIPEVNFRPEALPAYLIRGARVYAGPREWAHWERWRRKSATAWTWRGPSSSSTWPWRPWRRPPPRCSSSLPVTRRSTWTWPWSCPRR